VKMAQQINYVILTSTVKKPKDALNSDIDFMRFLIYIFKKLLMYPRVNKHDIQV